MIDPQTVQRILDAADIVEVVSDFVSLQRRGVNYIGLCPFHDEKTGSFTVSPSKGICKCFGCGKGGTPVNFIMQHEQLDYPGALRYLAKKYNITIEERELTAKEKALKGDRESMFALNDWAQEYFVNNLRNTDEGRNIALSYFNERGISDSSIQKFGLGYCLDSYNAMTSAATEKGYKEEYLEKTGLAGKSSKGQLYDRFKGRVMFPIHSISGSIVGFGGRIMVSNDKASKYVNSPESEIYHKSNELYGIYQAKNSIQKADKCFIVEGYTDVISMHQAGIPNAVAPSGTALTEGQIRSIRKQTKNVTLLYDGDNAGRNAAVKNSKLLLQQGMNVKIVPLPPGEDPDSFTKQNNASDFADFIDKNEEDFIKHLAQNLIVEAAGDPLKKAKASQQITQYLAAVSDTLSRSFYIKLCTTLFDIPESVLYGEIKLFLDKEKVEEAKKQGFNYNKRPSQITTPKYRTEENHQYINSILSNNTPPPPEDRQEEPPVELFGSQSEAYTDENYIPTTTEMFTEEVPPQEDIYIPNDYNTDPQESSFARTELGNTPFFAHEKEIINLVVRYADMIMNYEKDQHGELRPLLVGKYIIEELQELKESKAPMLYAPLYNKMMEILVENIDKPDFKVFRCFLSYPDYEINQVAADLMSDKYELSKLYTKEDEFTGNINDPKDVEQHRQRLKHKRIIQLNHEVTKTILTYKYKIVVDLLSQERAKLKNAEDNKDPQEFMRTIKRLDELNKIKNTISPLIGQRVVG